MIAIRTRCYYSVFQLEVEAQVARHVTGLIHSGEFGSRSPMCELFTGIAPGLLVLCTELTHFWQVAQDLQNLTIAGYSTDCLKHLFQSTLGKSAKRLMSHYEILPQRNRTASNSFLTAGLQKSQAQTKIQHGNKEWSLGGHVLLLQAWPRPLGGLETPVTWICLHFIPIPRFQALGRENYRCSQNFVGPIPHTRTFPPLNFPTFFLP